MITMTVFATVPSNVVKRPARLAFIGKIRPNCLGPETPQAIGQVASPTWSGSSGHDAVAMPAAGLR